MKKTLLVSLALLIGMSSQAFAVSSIPGRIDGDLYFHDKVSISSGVSYQSSLSANGGSSNVTFEGDGSLTIGKRLGQGFPRITFYGGTALTVDQNFGEGGEKKWWTGELTSPNQIRNIPRNILEWENEANHKKNGESMEGETKVLGSFGFGAFTDTYKFSPAAYLVLPVDAPNGAKVWYAFHNINTDECNASNCGGIDEIKKIKIVENNFCIIENNLCVVEVLETNQISLIEESFEKCPREAVANGEVGKIPYCVITCNSGYEIDENAVACIEIKDEESSQEETALPTEETHDSAPTATENFAGLSGDDLEKAIEEARLAGIGKKSYQSGHYTGDSLKLINTENLSGDELRTALRRNAQINKRRGVQNKREVGDAEEVSFLKKALNDVRGTLWSWQNQKAGELRTVATAETVQELELNNTEDDFAGNSESFSGHASAQLLPSSGSSTIFIIISILGIGLMMMALKRR